MSISSDCFIITCEFSSFNISDTISSQLLQLRHLRAICLSGFSSHPQNPSRSSCISFSLRISCVRSTGKPNVSYISKATFPGRIFFIFLSQLSDHFFHHFQPFSESFEKSCLFLKNYFCNLLLSRLKFRVLIAHCCRQEPVTRRYINGSSIPRLL